MTVTVPVAGGTSIDRIVFDMQLFDQPLVGQGSSPTMLLDFSVNGGRTFASEEGNLREVSLPARGVYGQRIQDFRFGRVLTENGFILRITITDPIGFALGGVWINPTDSELY
jgi:hypothetical protein